MAAAVVAPVSGLPSVRAATLPPVPLAAPESRLEKASGRLDSGFRTPAVGRGDNRSDAELVARLRIDAARGQSAEASPLRRGVRGDLMQSAEGGTFISSLDIQQLRNRLESRLATGPANGSLRRLDERA